MHLEFSELAVLLAQIAAIVFVSRSLGLVTRWLGQPLVIAEVLAGILLGPSLLGWLWPTAMTALFPASSLSSLKMLSQVGLVLFMFLIGLELDPKLLKGRTHSSVAISHTSIVLPFGLGAAAAYWMYGAYSSPSVPFLSFVLFLGVSMSVTAFPVLARILSERHLLSSRVGAIAIACAAVDDVTAWCLLAFVIAVARSQGVEHAIWTTVMAAGFIAFMLYFVRPFLRRLGARVANREGLTPTFVAAILVLLIGSSVVSELIGIHALFGAFLFGAILPKEGRLAEVLIEKLETPTVVMFLPLFFAYSGLRTQIGLVSQPSEWLVSLGLIAIATLGKFGGSTLAGRLTGLRWREASAVGILMNTRGLMELIVLNLGLDIGVISPTVFTMLVIMALVTTFATTPVLQWVYPDRELARDRTTESSPLAAIEPAPYTVMMCVSERSPGHGLATLSAALIGKPETPSRLLALHLWRPSDRPSVEQRRAAQGDAASPLKNIVNRARELALNVQPLEFVSSDVATDICRTAEAMHASLVLVGAHRPLLLEGELGGTVRHVLEHAGRPVGVFIDRGLQCVSRVLVALAGGSEDQTVLQLVRRIAAAERMSVTLLRVTLPSDAKVSRSPLVEELLTQPTGDGSVIRAVVIQHASPPDAVIAEAGTGYDLVILGCRTTWGLDTGLLHVLNLRRQRILLESPISVLAVHPVAQSATVSSSTAEFHAQFADSSV